MSSLLTGILLGVAVMGVGFAWALYQRHKENSATLTGRDWKTRSAAYRWDERARGIKVD